MKLSTLVVLAALLATPAFATRQKSAKGAELLLQLEAAFAQDVAQHGRDAFLTWFADDGVELDDGGGITMKEEMRRQSAWAGGATLTWTRVHADMAASGDLGYTYGNCVLKHKDKTGKLITDYGKYTSIWRKQEEAERRVMERGCEYGEFESRAEDAGMIGAY
jgi:ketosteroid isomerase-like protein